MKIHKLTDDIINKYAMSNTLSVSRIKKALRQLEDITDKEILFSLRSIQTATEKLQETDNLICELVKQYYNERKIIVERYEKHTDGIFSRLFIGDRFFCHILEHPDKYAPAKEYECFLRFSPKYKYMVYELKNVKNMTDIEMHIGNTIYDTKGCQLFGSKVGTLKKKGWTEEKKAVLGSAKAFGAFMKEMRECETFIMTITEKFK